MQGKIDSLKPKTFEILTLQKILVPNTENELEEINKENAIQLLHTPKDNLYVSIQPTASCQLACSYCGQSHAHKSLTDNLINQIVKRISKKLSETTIKSLEIGWFGGEPLMALSKMRLLNMQLKDIAIRSNLLYKRTYHN